AERTWLEAEGVLEEPGAENGRGAGNRDCNRRRSDRSRADAADADLAHGNRTLLLNQFLRSFPRRESSGRLARSFLFTSGSPLSRGRTDKARDLICAGHHLYPYCPYLFRDPYNDATAAMVWGRCPPRPHGYDRAQAPVAELVDAPDSKSGGGNIVLVRVRPGAPCLILRPVRPT